MTFLILLLVNHPKILEILVAEIDEAFYSKSNAITFAKTQDLSYLNAVISESMRLMPILMAGT
jgi:cytochrome P450